MSFLCMWWYFSLKDPKGLHYLKVMVFLLSTYPLPCLHTYPLFFPNFHSLFVCGSLIQLLDGSSQNRNSRLLSAIITEDHLRIGACPWEWSCSGIIIIWLFLQSLFHPPSWHFLYTGWILGQSFGVGLLSLLFHWGFCLAKVDGLFRVHFPYAECNS